MHVTVVAWVFTEHTDYLWFSLMLFSGRLFTAHLSWMSLLTISERFWMSALTIKCSFLEHV